MGMDGNDCVCVCVSVCLSVCLSVCRFTLTQRGKRKEGKTLCPSEVCIFLLGMYKSEAGTVCCVNSTQPNDMHKLNSKPPESICTSVSVCVCVVCVVGTLRRC